MKLNLIASLFGNAASGGLATFDEASTDFHFSATFSEALQMSHGDLANLLRTALRAEYPGERTWLYVRDVYDDSVVYQVEVDEKTSLYQRSYVVADGAVTMGDAFAVIAVTQYVRADASEITVPATQVTQVSAPATEAANEITGELVPLVEKSVKTDGTALIKIIAPGQGSSGFYPADVLKRDGPKVFTEGTQIFLDHPSVADERDRPERSVKDLAGSLTGPAERKEDGLYAPVKFIDSVAPHINAIASISGMSIRASGKAGTREIDGKKVRTIESIDLAHSVDVVTRAGAGGKVMDLIESARSGANPPEGATDVSQQEIDDLKKQLQESKDRETTRDQELARLREASILLDAQTVVTETLAAIVLPDVTRQRLSTSLALNPPIKEGALDREALIAKVTEAATAELAYLTSITGGNPVRGMGAAQPTGTELPTLEESDKRITEALAAL